MIMPITIFRCPHEPEALNEEFIRLFKECDILFIEETINEECNAGREYYSDLSNKGYSSIFSQSNFDNYARKFDSIVKGSKKQIAVECSPVKNEDFNRIEDLGINAINAFKNGEFEVACKKILVYSQTKIENEKDRENSLVKQLIELQKKDENKKILLPIGTSHPTYYKLKEKGYNVRQVISNKPFIFSMDDEILRRLEFNKPIKNELLAKSIVEYLIFNYIKHDNKPLHKSVEIARRIAEKLSYSDVKDLSKYISEDIYRRVMPEDATIVWLRKRGITID